jgi:hypothetical protein
VETLLERLSSGQIVAVVSILVGGIVAVVMIVSITKYQFQLLADETALSREKQNAELALKQRMIERGAVGTPGTPSLEALLATDMMPMPAAELDAELAKRFGYLDADSAHIEETLRRALALSPERKRAVRDVIDELTSNDAPHQAILAAVSALCDPALKERAASCGC